MLNILKKKIIIIIIIIKRPCFVPDKKFKYALKRYPGKEEITAPKS
jgi:hypothetical protein